MTGLRVPQINSRVQRRFAALAGVVALVAVSLVMSSPAASAVDAATLVLSKTTPDVDGPLVPGQTFTYELLAQCSGLTASCINAKTVDVVPAGIDIVPPPSTNQYHVDYVPATRTLTITYTDRLASPPNPPDSVGMVAGASRVTTIKATVRSDIAVPTGTVITNTGTSTADNTGDPSVSAAPVTVEIPRRVTAVASKAFSDNSLIAQSGALTTVTLGVHNASSSSAAVSSLSVSDTSKATWDDFDLQSIGPVGTFPAGADQVSVQYCTTPAPCTNFTAGPFVAGPTIGLPGGVDPATITGLQFVFSNSAGTTLPIDPTNAQVPVALKLRDTVRSTGAALNPTTALSQTNCATPAATDPVLGTVPGANVCANFTVQPGTASVGVSKTFFPDASGSFSSNGTAIAGQSSGASAISTAKNNSAFPVPTLTIVEPSQTQGSDFNQLNVSDLRLTFPTGATTATVTVTCRDGSTPAPVTLTPPPTTRPIASTGCPAGSPPGKISVTYSGSIAAGASGSLGVHGNVATTVAGNVSDCSDGAIDAGAAGSAAGFGCANLPVRAPVGTVSGTKTVATGTTGGKLVSGQPLTFNLSATNTGNLTQTGFTLQDPDPQSTSANPFGVVRLTVATLTASGGATNGQFQIQVLDGTNWVPYNAGDSALLTRAVGIRAQLVNGSMPPNGKINLSFNVAVRDGIPDGASILNCQRTFGTSTVGVTNASQCAPALTVVPPSGAGSVHKTINPASVPRPIAGVPPAKAQVRLQLQNTGNTPMNRLVATDIDTTFFDSVDFASIDGVNLPPGANLVKVDACTSVADCAAGTFVEGTAAPVPAALPGTVNPADVQGLRFTFSNSATGSLLVPGANLPTTGSCPNATVCFSVTPRATSRANPATPIGNALTDSASGAGYPDATTTTPIVFPNSQAPLGITEGTIQLGTRKTADPTAVGAGQSVIYSLKTTNTGTGAVPALTVTEPVPDGLVFDDAFAGTGGNPFTVTTTVPAGTPAAPTPTYTATRDPGTGKVTRLTWQYPVDFLFLPTSTVTFGFQAQLSAGTAAGQTITNTFGASTTDPTANASLTCAAGNVLDPTLGCTSSADVTAQAGSAVNAQKWVHGDDARGFYNTRTQQYVPVGDATCPLLLGATGLNYTRFPCIALTAAGQSLDFLLNITNVGTTPATQIRIVDELPRVGDTGVIVPGGRGTEWEPSPILAGAPTVVGGVGVLTLSYSNATKPCLTDLARPPVACAASAWSPAFAADATAFRGFLDFPNQLRPGQTVQIDVPMQAPTDLDTGTNPLPVAWNSFAHTDFMVQAGKPFQLPAVEPLKVGIGLPFGNLQINKTVTGPIPAGSLIGPFRVRYECTVTPAQGTPAVVTTGTGEFGPSAPLLVSHIPFGAVCKVWETDTGGGLSEHSSEATALTVPIDAGTADATLTADLTNNFPAPRLIITKAITGSAATLVPGPYVLRLACLIAGAPVPGYPKDLTFPDRGTQSITTVPIGATCSVSEPDDHGATSTTTTYSDGDRAVIGALVDATAAVTNTYDPSTLTVTKTVVGSGATGPFHFTTTCTLTSNIGTVIPVELAAADANFELSNAERHAFSVPKGSVCVVREIDTPAGVTVTYDGSGDPAPVTVDEPTTLSVVNTNPQTYAVGDYVWIDSNGNGIQDAGESPVEGVTVTLEDADGKPVRHADGTPVATTTTDPKGHYVFDDLPTGSYRVVFSGTPVGYVFTKPSASGSTAANDSNPNRLGVTPVFTLGPASPDLRPVTPTDGAGKAGAINPTIDAGLVPLVAVGDQVWLDTNRNGIRDEGEKPLPGVTVALLNADGTPARYANGKLVPPVKTDSAGRYLFDDLLPGGYRITFSGIPSGSKFTTPSAPGSTAVDDSNPNALGTTSVFTLSPSGPGNRPVTAGDRTTKARYINPTIDAGIVPPLFAVGDYVWLDANRNGIQDIGEKPVVGVMVTLHDGSGSVVGTTTTDSKGHYVFDGLPGGSYYVVFSKVPAGYSFTGTQVAAGTSASDSNPNSAGLTPQFTVGVDSPDMRLTVGSDGTTVAWMINPTIDAGLIVITDVGGSGGSGVGHSGSGGQSGGGGGQPPVDLATPSGELPNTGVPATSEAGVGLLLLLAGSACLLMARRRRGRGPDRSCGPGRS